MLSPQQLCRGDDVAQPRGHLTCWHTIGCCFTKLFSAARPHAWLRCVLCTLHHELHHLASPHAASQEPHAASAAALQAQRLHWAAHPQALVRHHIMAATASAASSAPLVPLSSIPAAQLPFPPCEPLKGREPGSFAHATITARLPSILAGMLRDLDTMLEDGDDKVKPVLTVCCCCQCALMVGCITVCMCMCGGL